MKCPIGYKLVKQLIPGGPTTVWKKNLYTGKLEPKIVHRKAYYRILCVKI